MKIKPHSRTTGTRLLSSAEYKRRRYPSMARVQALAHKRHLPAPAGFAFSKSYVAVLSDGFRWDG